MTPPTYKLPPGPRRSLFSLRALKDFLESDRDPLGFFGRYRQEHGDLVCFQVPGQVVMLVSHPDYIKHFLVDNGANYSKPSGIIPILGNGLLASDGEFWLRQRRMVQPAFHQDRLNNLFPLMVDSIQRMLGRWEEYAREGKPVEIPQEMLRVMLSITGRAAFTQDFIEQPGVLEGILKHNQIIHHRSPLAVRLLRRLFRRPPPSANQMREILEGLDERLYALIRERRQAAPAEPQNMLDMLIAARAPSGQAMTDKELRDEAANIFFAGAETSMSSLTWTWHLLDKHPEVRQRLRQEVSEAIGDRTPTLEDLPKLRYARMCFEEAMRLYPPAWVLGRQAREADTLGEWDVPPGTFMMTVVYHLQRDPTYWENPDRFEPERFLPERAVKRPRYSYFPFGGGQRQCIGNNMMLMQATLLIAMTARSYEVRTVPGFPVEAEASVTLAPKYGLQATIHAAPPIAMPSLASGT
ncbi:cytochrome P450 [Hyalangium versicolor]|uniref:cytochrome P450 n=1 Tax=Hyalangium versicolor TaxID=2861190 RepID=UPI001CCDD62C|nr:cytochrome P450 [Hyalangium versicolor]